MPRAILCILDSVGIGGAPDADKYGDTGSNTFGHIAEWAAAGRAETVSTFAPRGGAAAGEGGPRSFGVPRVEDGPEVRRPLCARTARD